MKNLIFGVLALGMVLVEACQPLPPKEDLIQDTSINEVPNLSDLHFEEALEAFKKSDTKAVVVQIEKGMEELRKEASKGQLASRPDSLIQRSLADLKNLAADIAADKVRDSDRLREVFTNAALLVSHEYLVSSDLYFLEPKKLANTRMNNKILDKASESFDQLRKELEGGPRIEADKIAHETEALQQRKRQLEQETAMHLQKMHDFVKTHKPEQVSHFPYYEIDQ